MTGGQRPAAPSAHSGADLSLAGLGAITGCDALLDLVAGRQLDTPLVRRDPALAVLSLLAADVDAVTPGPAIADTAIPEATVPDATVPDATVPDLIVPDRRSAAAGRPPARRPSARGAPAHRAGRRPPEYRPRQGAVAAIVASALAAMIVAVVVAGTTGLLAASTLARLTRPGRGPVRSRGR